MIRITVELLPFGFEEGKKVLGRAEIFNDLTGTSESGNYGFKLYGKTRLLRTGEIKKFPRKRLHVWYLVMRMLESLKER